MEIGRARLELGKVADFREEEQISWRNPPARRPNRRLSVS